MLTNSRPTSLPRIRSPFRSLASPVIAALLLLAGCSSVENLVPGAATALHVATERPTLTDADVQRMAEENAREFESSQPMWDDPLLQSYVSEITQRIGAVADSYPAPYRVRVVADPTVNAFTFGGGFIYLFAGLVARVENETQLAMILAHEIAHVTQRHISEGMRASFDLQLLGQLSAGAAHRSGALRGEALAKTYEYAMAAAVNGHGRSRESEADEVGLRYLVAAGYDPREAPGVFQVLYEEVGDQSALENFFWGSHPRNRSRFAELSARAEELRRSDSGAPGIVDTEEFRRRTRALVVATGILDYEQKRFETARRMFEKAVAVSRRDPVPFFYLGRIALETGGPDAPTEATRHLRAAIEADPDHAPAHRELGLAHYRAGDREAAVGAFRRYLELEPGADDAARVRRMIEDLNVY